MELELKDETDELLRMIGERLFHRKAIRLKKVSKKRGFARIDLKQVKSQNNFTQPQISIS
jgi:hypothetical protein